MHPSRRQSPLALSTCVVIVANAHMGHRRDGTMRVGTTTPDPLLPNENLTPAYIRLSSLLTCPHVQLLTHEFSVSGSETDLLLQWGAVVKRNSYFTNLDGNVTICLSDFLKKLDKDRRNVTPTEETLAIVLLSISIMCLLISIIVFFLFTVLRTLPGKNNMVLIVCLISSQMSMLLGYFSDDAIKMCALVGVSLHYFTLCVFCSLVTSSFHVYSMFTTMHLSRDAARDRKLFVAYCCFIFIVPLVIVASIIAIFASRNMTWRNLGYGVGSLCLMSSAVSLWLSLFLPLVVSMAVSFVLLCLTSNSLHHSKEVETNTTDEKHVNFYFRSALIISVAWIIGIAGIATSVVPLMITFIVLQCLLGLYVFMSLVLTPRVTGLLSGSCCQSRRPPRGRTSLNMKMASSNDCPVKPPCILGTGYRKRDPNLSGRDSKRHPVERYTKRNEFMESIA